MQKMNEVEIRYQPNWIEKLSKSYETPVLTNFDEKSYPQHLWKKLWKL